MALISQVHSFRLGYLSGQLGLVMRPLGLWIFCSHSAVPITAVSVGVGIQGRVRSENKQPICSPCLAEWLLYALANITPIIATIFIRFGKSVAERNQAVFAVWFTGIICLPQTPQVPWRKWASILNDWIRHFRLRYHRLQNNHVYPESEQNVSPQRKANGLHHCTTSLIDN